jgi:hypothetical protein
MEARSEFESRCPHYSPICVTRGSENEPDICPIWLVY